jgi:ABC-type molybdate transport system ATPase subunit
LLAHLKKNSHEQKHFGSNESRRFHKGKIATKMEMLEFTKLLDRFSSSFCTCEEDRIAGGGGCLPTYPFLLLLSELILDKSSLEYLVLAGERYEISA